MYEPDKHGSKAQGEFVMLAIEDSESKKKKIARRWKVGLALVVGVAGIEDVKHAKL